MKDEIIPARFLDAEEEEDIKEDPVAVAEQDRAQKLEEEEAAKPQVIDKATKKKNEEARKQSIKEHQKRKLVQLENKYTEEQFRGEYYVERVNMMATQISGGEGEIVERIDDAKKTMGLMIAEAKMMRRHGIIHLRNANFLKQELMVDFHLTEEDIQDIEDSFTQGKMIREEYDEKYNPKNKAGFVPTSED